MAGAGEACSHVGAALYAVESIIYRTDIRCIWNVPIKIEAQFEILRILKGLSRAVLALLGHLQQYH